MFTLLSLLFALRLGTIPAFAGPAPISLRAESREAVAEGGPRYGGALETAHWTSAPAVPEWPYPAAAGPAVGPVFTPYRPEEWVALVANRLHAQDLGIAHAAVWLAASPVRMNVSPRHVYLTVTLRGP